MEWDKGYSASYYMMEVDPNTWADIDRIEITGGSVNRSLDGLLQSATIDCTDYPQDKERYVRVYLDALQSGSGAHEAIFTGLAVSPDRDIRGSWSENTVQCYSVLKAADDVILARGYYAPAGVNCERVFKELLAPVPAPVEFLVDVPSLSYSLVAESGETNLTMVRKILTAIGWNMRIFGDGRIRFEPYGTEPVVTFGPLEYDIIENSISVEYDWFRCPNVFMVSSNGITAIARDTDPNSPLSIQNREREVWAYENGVALQEGESITAYAYRRLAEEQQTVVTARYDRRFVPNVFPGDFITLHYPEQGLDDDYMVTSQTITLGHSAKTSEEIIGAT